MAKKQKPLFKPKWATKIDVYDGRLNAAKPPDEREEEGWRYLEKPPRQYLNWLHHWTGKWIDYLDVAAEAGSRPATYVIAAEDADDRWRAAADYVVEPGQDAAQVINEAIGALPPQGGRIILSDGVFGIYSSILLPSLLLPVWIQGQGEATTISIRGEHSFPAFDVRSGKTAVISDLRIVRSQTATGEFCAGIKAGSGGELRVPLVIRGVAIAGMLAGGQEIWAGRGIHADRADVFVINSRVAFNDASGTPIAVSDGSKLNARGVRVFWPGYDPSKHSTPNFSAVLAINSDAELADCELGNCSYGFENIGVCDARLCGVAIHDVSEGGILVRLGTADVIGCTVASTGPAVCAIGNRALTIASCRLRAMGSQGTAIRLEDFPSNPPKPVRNARIVECCIEKADARGIQALGSPTGCVIAGNTIVDAKEAGIEINGTGNVCVNNVLTGPTAHNDVGIELKGERNSARGNTIDGYLTGVKMAGEGSVAADNHIINPDTGIDITSTGFHLVASSNVIRASKVIGIRRGTGNEAAITGNVIHADTGTGVQIEGEHVIVSDNQVTSSGAPAIYYKDGGGSRIAGNLIFAFNGDGIRCGDDNPSGNDAVAYVSIASNSIYLIPQGTNPPRCTAIKVCSNASAIHISGNYCSNGSTNIDVAKGECSVTANVSVSATETHVRIGEEVQGALVHGNVCLARHTPADYGLVVDAAASRGTVVTHNKLRGSGNVELRIIGALANVRSIPERDHGNTIKVTAIENNDVDPTKVQIG